MIRLTTTADYLEEVEFHRDIDSPVYERYVYAIDSDGHFLKPVRRLNCSVGDYYEPGSRIIYVDEWELPEDAVVVETLISVHGWAYRVLREPSEMTVRQHRAFIALLWGHYGIHPENDRDDRMTSETYRLCRDYIPEVKGDELVFAKPICGDDSLKDFVEDASRIPIRSYSDVPEELIVIPSDDWEEFYGEMD